MGSPKQLLRLDGESLVRRATRTALASQCAAVYVVVGAHASAVAMELDGLPSIVVPNPSWPDGVGSSIRIAVEVVTGHSSFDAVLIMLADQPAITSALLDRLIAAGERSPAGLAACEYAATLGARALFARRHFGALRELAGDRGGKALLAATATPWRGFLLRQRPSTSIRAMTTNAFSHAEVGTRVSELGFA